MSCRETAGNSATTSLIKFLTGAPEKLVSHEFHNLRRQGKTDVHPSDYDALADKDAVTTFLTHHKTLAMNDPKVKESRRVSLQERFDQAIVDVSNGKGPNNATFYAWANLRSNVEANEGFDDASADESIAGYTPEGLEISLGDVEAARRMADEAQDKLVTQTSVQPHSTLPGSVRYSRKSEAIRVAELRDKAERLQAAFDASETGYELLKNDPNAEESSAGHSVWKERIARAELWREKGNVIVEAKKLSSSTSLEELQTRKQEAIRQANHYQGLLQAGKQNGANTAKLEKAVKEAKHMQRAYLYKVGEEVSVAPQVKTKNFFSPSEWSSISTPVGISRDDAWRSAELLSADLDRARVSIGRISNQEAARRELKRAQARQAILDAEGDGKFDPANKKFARNEEEKRKTSMRIGVQ